jgi:hypothetical protein
MYIFHFIEMQIVKYLNLNINMDLGQFKIIGSINSVVIVNPKKFLIVPGTLCTSKNCALQLYLCKNSILKYKWILSVLKTSYPRILYDIFLLMLNELTFRLHVCPVLSDLVMFPWKTCNVAMEKSVF